MEDILLATQRVALQSFAPCLSRNTTACDSEWSQRRVSRLVSSTTAHVFVRRGCENDRNSNNINGLCGCSSMVELQLPKLLTWVRFPSPAQFGSPLQTDGNLSGRYCWQSSRNRRRSVYQRYRTVGTCRDATGWLMGSEHTVEASQAANVGSIPIARSTIPARLYLRAHCGYGAEGAILNSVWLR